MTNSNLVAIERDDTDDGSNQITRALDLSTTACIEAQGGDVVFVPVLERTDDGAALERTGDDCPVATTSVYSEHELRSTLSELGYADEYIESALAVDLDDERGRKVARIAESRTHDHPAQIESDDVDSDASEDEPADAAVATDGGEAVDDSDGDDSNDGRDRPTRSEPADFGGGEESGMDDLGDPAETIDTDETDEEDNQ